MRSCLKTSKLRLLLFLLGPAFVRLVTLYANALFVDRGEDFGQKFSAQSELTSPVGSARDDLAPASNTEQGPPVSVFDHANGFASSMFAEQLQQLLVDTVDLKPHPFNTSLSWLLSAALGDLQSREEPVQFLGFDLLLRVAQRNWGSDAIQA